LAAILEHSTSSIARWVAIAAGIPAAIAFEAIEGHWRVPLDAILPRDAQGDGRGHIAEFIRVAEGVRPVVALLALIATTGITARPKPLVTMEPGQ
jgi:hypothetical protein